MSVVGSEPKLEWFKINRVGFVPWILEWFYLYFSYVAYYVLIICGPTSEWILPYVRELEYSSKLCYAITARK